MRRTIATTWNAWIDGAGRGAARCLAALWLAGLALGCGGELDPGLDAITGRALEAHVEFLAGDGLGGREPGTAGSRLASLYIASQFELSGLSPAVGDTSYLMPVEFRASTPTYTLSLRARGGAGYRPEAGSDYVAWAALSGDSARVRGELAFVGYGIHAPELGWDDYKGVEVEGAVVLALRGEPDGPGSGHFRGDTLTYYGLDRYKAAEAARRGAAALLLVHTGSEDEVAWEALRNRRARQTEAEGMSWSSRAPSLTGWLSRTAAEQVADLAGLDFATLLESAASGQSRPIFTGVVASASVSGPADSLLDYHVGGRLLGSDPNLAQEVVIFTAHYDGLGRTTPLEGDSVFNGAYDNASGTALLLTLAQAFASLPERPRRSLLFLALTGEERGLLGSGIYVRRPLIPLDRTVAVIQLDGANLWGATTDVRAVGAGYSTLGRALRRAARAEELELAPDWSVQRGLLYRSSLYRFMVAGVPGLGLQHGLEYVGRLPGWGRERMSRFERGARGQRGDEYRPGMDMRGAVQQGRVALRLGVELANSGGRPDWLEGGLSRLLPDSAP